MVVNTSKENLCINKLVTSKKEIIFIEKDMIVPDAKPDILSTICTSGVVCLYKTELQDEKVRMDGAINTYIMYLAENGEDKVRGINLELDFSESINVPNAREGMHLKLDVKIKSIECKVINGRKIGVKATLEVSIEVYSNEEIQIVNNIEDDENIQILKEDLKVNSLVGIGDTKIYAKETIPVQNIDNIAEILKVNLSIGDKDLKISYNKILSKAEAKLKIMYLTEDNRISSVTGQIPLVGFIDIPNVAEGNICNTNYEIKNIIIKLNAPEEHSINVEMEVVVKCMVYEEKQINLIQDMYSPYDNLSFNKKQVNTMINTKQLNDTKQIREKINLNDISNKNLIDVDITPNLSSESRINNPNQFDGELECNFTFVDANLGVEQKYVKIPFEYTVTDMPENCNSNFDMQISNEDFVIQDGGDINCNIDMNILSTLSENRSLNIIEEVEKAEEAVSDQDYSVVVYIVKKGDTLWNIAKRFRTTVDFIARTNGIEDENQIQVGQKLYIPRYSKINV
ncbi:MAG: DUF3794 domain-containing protein [Clostridia bacterium]|nr:DUF3794 domain-containing protein [Clostridia bacterium]